LKEGRDGQVAMITTEKGDIFVEHRTILEIKIILGSDKFIILMQRIS
jgi:hypothetical protein